MRHTNATGKRHVEEPLNLLLNLLALLVQKYKRTNADAIYLLYWHKSTNTDAKAAGGSAGRGGWHRTTAHP
jgi:hypothetical protein